MTKKNRKTKRQAKLSGIVFIIICLFSFASGEMASAKQEESRGLSTSLNLLANTVPEEFKRLYLAHDNLAEYGLETPIPILTILETDGLDSALASLRAVPKEEAKERDRIARLFAADCAERVISIWSRHFRNDKRPQQALEVARRYAEGRANDAELTAAWTAVENASKDELASARAAYGAALVDAKFADEEKQSDKDALVKKAEEALQEAVMRIPAKKAARAALVTSLVDAGHAAWNAAWNATEAKVSDARSSTSFVASIIIVSGNNSENTAIKTPVDAAWAELRKAARNAAKEAGVAAKKAEYDAAKEAANKNAWDAVMKANKSGDSRAQKAAWAVWYNPDKDPSVATKKAAYDAAIDAAFNATQIARDAVVKAVRDAEEKAQIELLRKYLKAEQKNK